jgi:hypothetical protein
MTFAANTFYTSGELSACERALFDRFLRPGMNTSAWSAAPAMLDMARQLHPGIELVDGDARDLSAYDDASFDAVVFSSSLNAMGLLRNSNGGPAE